MTMSSGAPSPAWATTWMPWAGSTSRRSWLAAFLAATAFSAVHYLGSLGDAFTLTSFVFRLLSGLYLTLVYRTRGFAVAVYTHALYDLGIFFLVS